MRSPSERTPTPWFREVSARRDRGQGLPRGLHTDYLRWAAFAADAQDGDFGFGAYFTDERGLADNAPSGSSMTQYTWTPAGTR